MRARATLPDRALGTLDSSPVLSVGTEDKDLVLERQVFKAAIEASGWKKEAVAADLEINPEYLSKLFSGEKPLMPRHVRALPGPIKKIHARLYAEAFGHLVVTPVEGDLALQQFVSGLVGLLVSRLPVKARMAKAGLK